MFCVFDKKKKDKKLFVFFLFNSKSFNTKRNQKKKIELTSMETIKNNSINKFLPKDEQELNEKESSTYIEEIIKNLEWSIRVHDLERGASFYNKSFQNWVLMKEQIGLKNANKLISLYEELIGLKWIDNSLLSKFLEGFSKLLQRCKSEKLNVELKLSWRSAYDLIEERIYSNRYRGYLRGENSIKNLKNKLISFAKMINKFKKGENNTNEILKLIRPFICQKEKIIYKAVGYLSLFLSGSEAEHWLAELMQIWKSMKGDDTWNSIFINLAFKAAKKGSNIDWNQHLEFIFTQIQESFKVGLDKLPKVSNDNGCPKSYHWISKSGATSQYYTTGKLIATLLSKDSSFSSVVYEKSQSLLSTLEIYCNPSNHGDWAKRISSSILGISFCFAKNMKNKNEISNYENKIFEKIVSLNTLLMYSKAYEVPDLSRKTFYNLAQVNKELILNKVIEIVFTGLNNSLATHQIGLSFELLAQISSFLFDGTWEDGSKHLDSILQISLSGIDFNDQNKTQATFKFLYSLFSIIPITDKLSQPKNNFQQEISERNPFSDW